MQCYSSFTSLKVTKTCIMTISTNQKTKKLINNLKIPNIMKKLFTITSLLLLMISLTSFTEPTDVGGQSALRPTFEVGGQSALRPTFEVGGQSALRPTFEVGGQSALRPTFEVGGQSAY